MQTIRASSVDSQYMRVLLTRNSVDVPIGGSLKAIQQLETILGVDLTGGFLAANGRLPKL